MGEIKEQIYGYNKKVMREYIKARHALTHKLQSGMEGLPGSGYHSTVGRIIPLNCGSHVHEFLLSPCLVFLL